MAANNGEGSARGKVTVSFGDLIISSDFDSGNIDRVEQVGGEESLEFNLWTALDCAGTEFENPNSSWFYFKVSIPAHHNGKAISFNIMNMNRQWRLYQQGLTPIMKVGKGNWERMTARPTFEVRDTSVLLYTCLHCYLNRWSMDSLGCLFNIAFQKPTDKLFSLHSATPTLTLSVKRSCYSVTSSTPAAIIIFIIIANYCVILWRVEELTLSPYHPVMECYMIVNQDCLTYFLMQATHGPGNS